MSIAEKGVEKFYQSYDFKKVVTNTPPLIQEFIDKEIILLQKLIKKNSFILEVGCGYGRIIKILSPQTKKVIGIDYSKPLLQEAKINLSGVNNVSILSMNAKNLRFEYNTFDYSICMNATYGNMPNIELRVLSEMKRATKIGGKIFVTVFSEDARESQLENYNRLGFTILRESPNAIYLKNGLYSRRFSLNDLHEIFNKINLKCKITKFCPIGYFIIGEKT